MDGNSDLFDKLKERLKQETGEPLTEEFVFLGNKLLGDNAGSVEATAVATGMALAGMKLCDEHDPLRYYDFLFLLGEHIHSEIVRVEDRMKLPVAR
jgi:hypothetical protein